MKKYELEQENEVLQRRIDNVKRQAASAGRPLDKREKNLIEEIRDQIDENELKIMSMPLDPVTRPGSHLGGGNSTPTRAKSDTGGFESIGEIMAAIYRKNRGEGFDERLKPLQIQAATQIGETVPSEGGFVIPTQFVERALNEDLDDTVLLRTCDRQEMRVNDMTVPAFVDDNHSTSSPFGITWSQIAEGASFGTTQGTPFRALSLSAKKSGALFAVNNEWLADSSAGIRQRLENIWRASLRWYVEDMLWTGTGAGMPLGALVGAGAVSVGIENGQADNTLVTENIVKAWARLRPGSHSRGIWVCNATCFPQLATLSLAVGTGGGPVGLLQTNSSITGAPGVTILGRPLYMSEHLPAVGNSGDIVLLDPLLYLLGDRKQITLDASPHLKFDLDQTIFRASARLDGQPIYSTALTPKNGDTCGWLVKIDDRV